MIYIVKGPFMLCMSMEKVMTACCKAITNGLISVCSECGQCIEHSCKCSGALIRMFSEMCGGFLECIVGTLQGIVSLLCSCVRLDQPLGVFVLFVILVNVPYIYFSSMALTDLTSKDTPEYCLRLSNYLYAYIVIGLVNIFTAVYLKKKVNYDELNELRLQQDELLYDQEVGIQVTQPPAQITPAQVFQSVYNIFLYDFCFCFYFFGCIAAVFISAYGLMISFEGCPDNAYHASLCELVFVLLLPCYACCFTMKVGTKALRQKTNESVAQKKPKGCVIAREGYLPLISAPIPQVV